RVACRLSEVLGGELRAARRAARDPAVAGAGDRPIATERSGRKEHDVTEMQITAEPGVPQILTSREFAAPRDLVFRAFTEPDLLVQWLGPRRYKMTIDRWDLRDGGTYRYVHADEAGNEFGFHGVFHGDPSRDGKTIVRINSVFQSVQARDAMVDAGMASGMSEGYERLDDLLARLVANG